jgi:protein-tyrosine-phosphatase
VTDDLRLLFVCSGNICRSPMAAGLADRVAMELGLEVEIRSAGTLGIVDRPADPKMVAVAREIGIDLRDHRSQGLTAELVGWADRVLVMELEHAEAVTALHEGAVPKIVQLGPLVGQPHIADPIGSWFKARFRRARDELSVAVRRVLENEVSSRRP